MHDQCKNHNAIIDLLFTFLGSTSAQQRNLGVGLAALMVVESATDDRGRTPEDMAMCERAARILESVTPEQRNEALYFLAMLKRIVTIAGNTLAIAKHIYRDPDAEERAPGYAPMAEKLKTEAQASDPLASIFGKPPAPPRGDPRWN